MFLPTLLCAAITPGLLAALKQWAPRLGLIEHPHGHRTHDMPTPVVGGIAMAVGLTVT